MSASDTIIARRLRCGRCGHLLGCSPTDLFRYARDGWPRCCAEVMSFDAVATGRRERDRRCARRLALKAGAQVEVRAGGLGRGPDLGLGLVDVSGQGACVRVKTRLDVGAEVEVRLTGPGCEKSLTRSATVCWCRPDGRPFRAGLRLRRRLDRAELIEVGQAGGSR